MFLTWTSVKVPRPKAWDFLPGQVLRFLDLKPGVSLTWTSAKVPRPKAWCFSDLFSIVILTFLPKLISLVDTIYMYKCSCKTAENKDK